MADKPNNQKVTIGFQKLKRLKSMIHWAKDRQRIGLAIDIDSLLYELDGQQIFLEQLTESTRRDNIREIDADSRATRAKEASPGKLKDEAAWDKWEQGVLTLFSIKHGVNGVPIGYVVQEVEHTEGDEYTSFVEECIARAKLEGPEFEADARSVHHTLQSLTVGQNAEHWLRELGRKNNGRLDMAALRSHYRGAGNQSRRVNQAKKLHETLHYKNERAMKFSDFISKAKMMFNIYEECKEPQPETVKLRFLWDKVDNPTLLPAIQAMKAQLGQNSTAWMFVTACDHLASQIPADGATRTRFTASALEKGGGGASSTIMRDGKVHTGTYSKDEWWNVLSNGDRDQPDFARCDRKFI
jgi:hypothetical protein